MSVLRPKTIILSAQSVRPAQGSALVIKRSPITDLDSILDDGDIMECEEPRKRRRLTFLSPEEKMVRRLVEFRLQ